MDELIELKQYIDDSVEDFTALAECTDEKEKHELLCSIYANFYDLRKECGTVIKVLQKQYKIRESEMKEWCKNNPVEQSEEEKDSDGDDDEKDFADGDGLQKQKEEIPKPALVSQAPVPLPSNNPIPGMIELNLDSLPPSKPKPQKKALFKKPVKA